MKHASTMAVGILIAVASGTARADIVTDWNHTAIEVMKVARVAGNPWSRTLAMVHVAMSDAINSVQGRYACYVATIPVVPGASAEAARDRHRGSERCGHLTAISRVAQKGAQRSHDTLECRRLQKFDLALHERDDIAGAQCA
jgi:hypothetical protein